MTWYETHKIQKGAVIELWTLDRLYTKITILDMWVEFTKGGEVVCCLVSLRVEQGTYDEEDKSNTKELWDMIKAADKFKIT